MEMISVAEKLYNRIEAWIMEKLVLQYRLGMDWGGHTDWYRNLLKDPSVKVQVGRKKFDAIAEKVCDEEVAKYMLYVSKRHPRTDKVSSRWSDKPVDRTFDSLSLCCKVLSIVLVGANIEHTKGFEMNRIYFVRHGEGQDNVARQFSYKRVDRPLTERGELQARQTAEYLAGMNIDQIFCSPMKRAHETAQIIAQRLGKELIVLEDFREVNVGDLDGQPFNDEGWGIYHDITNAWYAGQAHVAYPGGEDYVTLWKRMQRGLKQIMGDYSNCNFVLVGHGGIFGSTLQDYCPGLEISWLQNVEYYNCAITELEVEMVNGELKGRIVDWASYRHLSGEALTKASAIPPLVSIKRV